MNKWQERINNLLPLLLLALVLLLFFSVLRASLFSEVEESKRVWFEITFLLFAAVLAELLVVYLKQPYVMVLLFVGIVLSPSVIALVWPIISQTANAILSLVAIPPKIPTNLPSLIFLDSTVKIFAQLGAIILLFKIGLHSEIKEIFNLRNFFVALLGVIFPFVAGYLFAIWSNSSFQYAMFLGAALTATSVGVTVAVLQELKVMDRGFAKLILGAAVIDDILALLVLSLVLNFPSSLDVASVAPFATILATALVFVTGGIVLGKYIVSNFIDKIKEEALSPKTFLIIMSFVLSYSYVAEFIGLSGIVGAFLAGICLNYSKKLPKIYEAVFPLETFFTPIFFISLGLLIDVNALYLFAVPIIVITMLAIATKIIGCGVSARLAGMKLKESLIVGIGMIPRGEVALIVGLYGLTANVITSNEYSIIASMAFLTTVIVPPVLKKMIR